MIQKRILYIEQNTDGTVGGSYFSLLFLVQGLDKSVYKPIVVFYQTNRLIPSYEEAGCKVLIMNKSKVLNMLNLFPVLKAFDSHKTLRLFFVIPFILIQKTINYFLAFIFPAFKCWYILKKEKIDLVHLNNTLLRPQQWILATLFTKAKIIAHERGINDTFPFQTRFWARFLDRIVCISDAVKNNLMNYGFPENQLIRIYNGLDPAKFIVKKSREETLKELGIQPGCQVLGIVGNIKSWKGQETVIKSMVSVKKSFPDVKCLIIGSVSPDSMNYYEKLKNIVKHEELGDVVLFTGSRNDIPDLINCLSVLIHASILPEPFGRVLLEGMALEKPVITTSIGAGPEIIKDGETGLIVSPGDALSLADAVIKLMSDPNKAVAMGKSGRKRLTEHFTVLENVRQTEQMYSRILS